MCHIHILCHIADNLVLRSDWRAVAKCIDNRKRGSQEGVSDAFLNIVH